jgi:glutaredoxin
MWFGKPPLRPATVVMYTRAGCGLCEEAWHLLESLAKAYPLELRTIDISSDETLSSELGKRIPVIEVNGRERMWGKINAVMLERLVNAQTKGQ